MTLDEWPIYISDYGIVDCHYHPGCDGELYVSQIGRRTTFGELSQLIRKHALDVHNIQLDTPPSIS